DRTTVTNTLRLLRLPREVRELLNTGGLDAGHGRALLALEKAEEQTAPAREVERRVALLRAPRTKAAPTRDANTRAAEERLRAALGTRVQIARRGRGGQLQIAFATEAELNRLYELLVRPGRPRPS